LHDLRVLKNVLITRICNYNKSSLCEHPSSFIIRFTIVFFKFLNPVVYSWNIRLDYFFDLIRLIDKYLNLFFLIIEHLNFLFQLLNFFNSNYRRLLLLNNNFLFKNLNLLDKDVVLDCYLLFF